MATHSTPNKLHDAGTDVQVGEISAVSARTGGEKLKIISGLSADKLRFKAVLKLKGGARVSTTLYRQDVTHAWRVRAMVDGRRRAIALDVYGTAKDDLALACAKATARLQELWDGSYQSHREVALASRGVATLAELAKVYVAGMGARAGTGEGTMKEAVSAARLMLRTALDAKDVGAVCLSCLDGDAGAEMVRRFQHLRLATLPARADGVTAGRLRRATDGVLRKMKGMLTDAALEVYRQAGLKLPDVAKFLAVPPLGNWNEAGFVPIPVAVLNAMTADAWGRLRASDPGAFCCYLLMRRAGMRNGDAMLAERDWLVDDDVMVLDPRDGKIKQERVTFIDFVARKNGAHGRVPLAADVASALRGCGGERFLLGPESEAARYEIAYREMNEWARGFIPSLAVKGGRAKGMYEFRKHFGATVASNISLERAAQYLGDLISTTQKFYHAWLTNNESVNVARTEDFTPEVRRVQRV